MLHNTELYAPEVVDSRMRATSINNVSFRRDMAVMLFFNIDDLIYLIVRLSTLV